MNTKEFKLAKTESLARYNKMIAYAEAQYEGNPPSRTVMWDELGDCWGWTNCSFCIACGRCSDCPLGDGASPCCNGLYDSMGKAETWKVWLEYAVKVRAYIENAKNI